MTPMVRFEVAGPRATITLDSPHNRNALSVPLLTELAGNLRAAADDPVVRVVVLTGAGTVFCSGADLSTPGSQKPLKQFTSHLHDEPVELQICT